MSASPCGILSVPWVNSFSGLVRLIIWPYTEEANAHLAVRALAILLMLPETLTRAFDLHHRAIKLLSLSRFLSTL
jgi:hypothetical protein